MSNIAKRMLFILDMPQILFFQQPVNGLNIAPHIPITYDQTINHNKTIFRKGKQQMLTSLFQDLNKEVDIAVWSCLQNQQTGMLCHRYFKRHYRSLLFALGTNRGLYNSEDKHSPIKIRRDLTMIYNKFPGYTQTNTFVVSTTPNLLQQHARNDILIPAFTPVSPSWKEDPGLVPLVKYIRGLIMVNTEEKLDDLRKFVAAKPISNMYSRASHNLFAQKIYN